MDLEQVEQDIMAWLINFVEQPNHQLNGWPPCPFARRARLDDRIQIRLGADPYLDLMRADLGSYDVLIYVYNPARFSSVEFNELILRVNQGFLLAKNMIALADHPDDQEIVNGVCMNQGQYAIAFVQELHKLNVFSRQLAQKQFYNGWPDDYLKVLFEGREDPRS
jgi:hypothetical protein